jgi:putative SOS response-associated peptidase YedK
VIPPTRFVTRLESRQRDPAVILPLLRPYPAEEMQVTEVGPVVNSPQNDGPQCLDAD